MLFSGLQVTVIIDSILQTSGIAVTPDVFSTYHVFIVTWTANIHGIYCNMQTHLGHFSVAQKEHNLCLHPGGKKTHFIVVQSPHSAADR